MRGLLRGQAHVWALPVTAAADAAIEKLRPLLSGEETARVERIQSRQNRREYQAAHILTRLMLSSFGDVEAADWCFIAGKHGRPELETGTNSAGLRFNLSHAGGMVACAVTTRDDIGVDVEWLERPNRRLDEVAEKKFSTAEAAYLSCVPERDRRHVFFSFWTLKESYIKAIGRGLVEPLDGFAFDLDSLAISFPDGNGEAACWEFDLFQPSPVHLCAVSLARPAGAPSEIARRVLDWDKVAGLVAGAGTVD